MDISQDHAQKTVTIDTHPHMQVGSCSSSPFVLFSFLQIGPH
jgi:hypothetical protein